MLFTAISRRSWKVKGGGLVDGVIRGMGGGHEWVTGWLAGGCDQSGSVSQAECENVVIAHWHWGVFGGLF